MSWVEELQAELAGRLGTEIGYDEGFGPPTFDVGVDHWTDGLRALRELGFGFFDWLSAVDELEQGFTVVCHVAAPGHLGGAPHVLLRTRVPRDAPRVPSATEVYAGARWHERETREMFGIEFTGHPGLAPLLLPDEFEGHPLRKEFVLAARVAKPWPGAKDPGESDADLAKAPRRKVQPPGVPASEAWGPREPGSAAPDPLAAAQPARPARKAARPARKAAGRREAPPAGEDGDPGEGADG